MSVLPSIVENLDGNGLQYRIKETSEKYVIRFQSKLKAKRKEKKSSFNNLKNNVPLYFASSQNAFNRNGQTEKKAD